MGLLVRANDHLNTAELQAIQWALNEPQRALVEEVLAAQAAVQEAHRKLVRFHRNRRGD